MFSRTWPSSLQIVPPLGEEFSTVVMCLDNWKNNLELNEFVNNNNYSHFPVTIAARLHLQLFHIDSFISNLLSVIISPIQCATGNPVPVDPVHFFRSGSGPSRPNTDRI